MLKLPQALEGVRKAGQQALRTLDGGEGQAIEVLTICVLFILISLSVFLSLFAYVSRSSGLASIQQERKRTMAVREHHISCADQLQLFAPVKTCCGLTSPW